MMMDNINDMVERAINANEETIDIKALSDRLVDTVDITMEDAKVLVKEKIEQKARNKIARIKGIDNVRDFFATPVDKRKGVYINAVKSRDDEALEKTAEVIDLKIAGLKAARDKLMGQVFRLRHNVEIKDDGTIDPKTPYTE